PSPLFREARRPTTEALPRHRSRPPRPRRRAPFHRAPRRARAARAGGQTRLRGRPLSLLSGNVVRGSRGSVRYFAEDGGAGLGVRPGLASRPAQADRDPMNSTLPYDPDRYRQLRELVDRAAERPTAEWASFLERECPTDLELQSEALRLLEQALAASADGFLEPSAPSAEPSSLYVSPGEPDPGS